MIMYKQRNSYDKNCSANSDTVVCTNSCLFVVRDLNVGQGRHGGQVDHVKDLAEALHHVQVVKNPDLVRFCDHYTQRNLYYDKNRSANSYTCTMCEFCFICSSRPSCGPRP